MIRKITALHFRSTKEFTNEIYDNILINQFVIKEQNFNCRY